MSCGSGPPSFSLLRVGCSSFPVPSPFDTIGWKTKMNRRKPGGGRMSGKFIIGQRVVMIEACRQRWLQNAARNGQPQIFTGTVIAVCRDPRFVRIRRDGRKSIQTWRAAEWEPEEHHEAKAVLREARQ